MKLFVERCKWELATGDGNMTDLEKAQIEWEKVENWVMSEEDKITAQIKAKGIQIGLDSNNSRYQPIYDEAKKRLAEIKAKYKIDGWLGVKN